jgi:hypothetical protein
MHICYSVADNCQNLYDSYGEICVGCNCCGRIDPKTKLQCQLELAKRQLEEKQQFDMWDNDYPEVNAIQHKNVAADIKYFKQKIAKIEQEISADIEAARKEHP